MKTSVSYACDDEEMYEKRQRHAGDHLDDERHQRGAAEDVPPARVVRHQVLGGGADQVDDAEPVVDPCQASSKSRFIALFVIGIGADLICTCRSRRAPG